jgi:hypothetical protein
MEMFKFQPSNTPYCQFGEVRLNGKVHWQTTIADILNTNAFTLDELAQKVGTTTHMLKRVYEQNDASRLAFKTGAKILGVHCRYYPHTFC